MEFPVVQIEWRGKRIDSVACDHILSVYPVAGYPHGRKAYLMAQIWQLAELDGAPGVLWLDPDVAADPDDLAAMAQAVRARPGAVHTGVLKLWPESTGRGDWIWSHRPGTLGAPQATQDETAPVSYFAMGFVYTPAHLLNLAAGVMPGWQWAEVDVGLSELALRAGIPAYTVPGCRPKHLHFREAHGDQRDDQRDRS